MEAVVDGSHGDGGLCRRGPSLTEAMLGWRRDDGAMASAVMVSLADGGSANGGHCCQLCSGS